MTVPVQDPGEGVVVAILAVGLVLMWAVRRLGRTRPELRIGTAVLVAYAVRLLAVVAINATGVGAQLRGGDEVTFIDLAQKLAAQPLGHGDLPHGLYQLQTVLFALQIKTGFLNETALRVTQIGIALLGFVLIIAAVYDLGGSRAARVAAWCLAFEPASIFFNSEIHREALLDLAAGLVVFGGTWLWKRMDLRGILICAVGCLIAIETREYAGWFMACGVALMVLHASFRHMKTRSRALPLIYAVVIAATVATPTLLSATGGKNLKHLQTSQQANATGRAEGSGDKLALEQVDFSSRGAIITSLPTKVRELILEPYPWQLQDASQMFGAVGTLVVYLVLILLARYAWLSRQHIFETCGPLLYPLLFEMICYALSVGNAGTGFRYRSHLTVLAIGVLAILRARTLQARDVIDVTAPELIHQPERRLTPATA